MRGVRAWPWVIGGAALALTAAAPAPGDEERARLAQAKAQSAEAQARADRLQAAADAQASQAKRAQADIAATAARIQKAEADIAAAEARIALVRRALADQRRRLAGAQGPMARLIAALQSLARRPVAASLVQPGSVSDLVHVRAVLATTAPVIAARTAGLRADLARSRRLEAGERLAVRALADGRVALETQRLALARFEAEHRLASVALGRDALVESDRALALGERARDLAEQAGRAGDAADTLAELRRLPAPLPRPPQPGDAAPTPPLAGDAAYRLPAKGRLETGLGEVLEAGFRSRGLTIATAPGAPVIAPAAGRIAYARPFRDYGVVIILDHGGGWTTLIAGLGAARVSAGEVVRQGAVIAQAAGGERPRLTIELRRRDRPIDLIALLG